MIAAFMLGRVTRLRRCRHVAPSTLAASCRSSGTWARPANSRSDMNGVVFQISDMQMTNSDDHRWPNQAKLPRPNQLLMKPVSIENAYFHANAETTVMTVMITVVKTSCHHSESVSTTP